MDLENQVCNFELSKRLKELRVKQESLFWWVDDGKEYPEVRYQKPGDTTGLKLYSAFTVAEMGEMLPSVIDLGNRTGKEMYWLQLHKYGEKPFWERPIWGIYYETPPDKDGVTDRIPDPTIEADTEADARAKMLIHLIYLLENNLIS